MPNAPTQEPTHIRIVDTSGFSLAVSSTNRAHVVYDRERTMCKGDLNGLDLLPFDEPEGKDPNQAISHTTATLCRNCLRAARLLCESGSGVNFYDESGKMMIWDGDTWKHLMIDEAIA